MVVDDADADDVVVTLTVQWLDQFSGDNCPAQTQTSKGEGL